MKHLFSPITINGMTVPNRIVMPAMHLNFTMGGDVNDQLIAFYRERAEGGAGLIIIGGCSIDKLGGGPMLIGLDDDRFLPGLQRFVGEVKANAPDVKLCTQLYQAGRYSWSVLIGQQPISSSAIASRYTKEMPRALETHEIPGVQDSYAEAAARAKQAGFDSVEILGSAGYLISQFLSPVVNQREDEYGGPFENRVRFGVEVVEKVRKAVGPDYPVLIRVAGSDYMEGSHTNEESAEVCKLFEKAGVDAINVTGGWHETRVPQLTMGVPRGAYVYLASGIKRAVNVPVVASNRIPDPLLAERILAEERCDMVAMGRPLIADPELPNKARRGEIDSIRTCIACNQGCFDSVFKGLPVRCMVNARVGREADVTVQNADQPGTVVVIGGGPAGMEAARVAAQRGHKVVLYESRDQLGGLLPMAAAPPGRCEFNELTRYLSHEVNTDPNIDVRLNAAAGLDEIRSHDPKAVIVATGAEPIVPPFAGDADTDRVLMAHDVLAGRVIVKGDVAIVGAGAVGCETALYLADRDVIDPDVACFLLTKHAESPDNVENLLNRCNRRIMLVEMKDKIGEDIGKTTRWTVTQDLRRYGVEMFTHSTVDQIVDQGLQIKTDSGEAELLKADSIIIAVGYAARENKLFSDVEAAGLKAHLVGDAKGARKAIDAIHEGFDAAMIV